MKTSTINNSKELYDYFYSQIAIGKYKAGEELPSQNQVAKKFELSRPTIAKTINKLQEQGLVSVSKGKKPVVSGLSPDKNGLFGLIAPLLFPERGEHSIFFSICKEISHSLSLYGKSLIINNPLTSSHEETLIKQCNNLCERLIRHNIDGVFFAPLIINDNSINSTVANKMKQAGIGVVLLDRCVCNYPNRSEFDLVSMDNVNAGYIATKHLLSLGCKKIHFLTHKKYVSTSNERIVGYRAALAEEGISTDGLPVIKVSPFDRDEVQNAYQVHKPQALVIIDDESASNVMNFLLEIGVKIPEELRIVSFDDLYYSKDLPVPLTTIRQPTQEIGALATNLMLQRLENAKMRSRKLTITGELIIRESCGARL